MLNLKEQAFIIEENLFRLYRRFNSVNSFKDLKCKWFESINSKLSEWPNFIYNFKTGCLLPKDIQEPFDGINSPGLPSFLISNSNKIDQSIVGWLKQSGFLPVMRWPGMILNITENFSNINYSDSFEIKRVSEFPELKKWINIVNKTLFNGIGLNAKVFLSLLNDSELNFLLAYYNGEPCGTLLAHTYTDCMGIYLVSTLPYFRGKGCMKSLIGCATELAKQENLKQIVLEANKSSFDIYKKLGFTHICDFDIYWRK